MGNIFSFLSTLLDFLKESHLEQRIEPIVEPFCGLAFILYIFANNLIRVSQIGEQGCGHRASICE